MVLSDINLRMPWIGPGPLLESVNVISQSIKIRIQYGFRGVHLWIKLLVDLEQFHRAIAIENFDTKNLAFELRIR